MCDAADDDYEEDFDVDDVGANLDSGGEDTSTTGKEGSLPQAPTSQLLDPSHLPQTVDPQGGGYPRISYSDLVISEKQLGGGSFAVIHSGTLLTLPCAVKIIVDPRCASPAQKMEFQSELQALCAKGEHPCLVRLLGACTTPRPCIAMELLGRTLRECMVGGPPTKATPAATAPSTSRAHAWPLHCVLSWGADVASGLAHLHTLTPPMLHRDIKTSNVLLRLPTTTPSPAVAGAGAGAGAGASSSSSPSPSPTPPWGRAVIADFGLCFNRTPAAGTPTYMAPELLAALDTEGGGGGGGGGVVGRGGDLYALGMLLWALLSGEEPWVGWRTLDVKAKVCGGGRPEGSRVRGDTPPGVRALMEGLWSGEVGKRPPAGEAAGILLRAAADAHAAWVSSGRGKGGGGGIGGGVGGVGGGDALDAALRAPSAAGAPGGLKGGRR